MESFFTLYILTDNPLKFVAQFIYIDSNILSTESDINIRIGKACVDIDWLIIICIIYFSDKIKPIYFEALTM